MPLEFLDSLVVGSDGNLAVICLGLLLAGVTQILSLHITWERSYTNLFLSCFSG
jgi:hypothetical protein